VKETIALEKLEGKDGFYARILKGKDSKLHVAEPKSIVDFVRKSDIVMLLQNVNNTSDDLLKLISENIDKNTSFITSGNIPVNKVGEYERWIGKYFKLKSKEDISLNISHGMSLDTENKIKVIYKNLYAPISTIMGKIIAYNDSKYVNEIRDKKTVHCVFEWESK